MYWHGRQTCRRRSPHFPGEDLLAAVLAGRVLAGACAFVHRVGGKCSHDDLLFVAGFAAFVVLLSVGSTGVVPLLTPLPALLVGLPFALAAVRQSPLLRLAGLSLGVLYAVAGVFVSLVGTFG